MIRLTLRALLVSGLLLTTAWADTQPHEWYQRMTDAVRHLNYQGVLLYGNQQHWDSLAIEHAVVDGEVLERLRQLTGQPLEQMRRGQMLLAGVANHGRYLHNPLYSFLPDRDLGQYYRFSLEGMDRVAGYPVRQLLLAPQDAHRFGMRLWLEQDTALLLRSDLLDEYGRVLERFQFASLHLDSDVDARLFHSDLPWQSMMDPQEPQDTAVSWQPDWLPPGFERISAHEQGGNIRLQYADGVAVFSLFIDEYSEPVVALEQRWGATAAVVRRVQDEHRGARRVTAVGELPAATLVNIVQSVQPVVTDTAVTAVTEQEAP